jgi:predicted nucleic acid-binding protein
LIVADTNLVVYLVLPGDFTAAAEAIRLDDREWVVPVLFRYELMNVLAGYVRAKKLDRHQAIKLYQRGMKHVVFSEFDPEESVVFDLAFSSGCSTYDMEFVALAEHLGVRLATADKKLIAAFPNLTIDLKEWPPAQLP